MVAALLDEVQHGLHLAGGEDGGEGATGPLPGVSCGVEHPQAPQLEDDNWAHSSDIFALPLTA